MSPASPRSPRRRTTVRPRRKRPVEPRPVRVISGAQTGVDRAALDAARAAGLPIGGWCPAGRRAEDGPISRDYPLHETPSRGYAERTNWNVRDSDATLILTAGPPVGGTALTLRIARRLDRPVLIVDLHAASRLNDAAERIRVWIEETGILVLNVAGPRETTAPGITRAARELLDRVFDPSAHS